MVISKLLTGGALSALALLLMSPVEQQPAGHPLTNAGFVEAGAQEFDLSSAFDPAALSYDSRLVFRAAELTDRFGESPGFGGVELVDQESAIVLRWVGSVPIVVRELLSAWTSAGVPVSLVPADFSAAYLEELARATSHLLDPTLESRWALSAYPASDGSGLVVGTRDDSPLLRMDRPQLAAALGVSVPVTTEIGGAPLDGSTYLDDRQVDGGALNGGARIKLTPLAAPCSSGFAIFDQRADRTGMLSAWHCGGVGESVQNNGDYKGDVMRTNATRDISIIRGNPDGYAKSVYEGNWYSADKVRVGGLLTASKGIHVVVSGASSGTMHGVYIHTVSYYENGDGPFIYGQRLSAGGAGGGGDSGGPLMRYYTTATGETRVRAVGIVSRGVPGYRMADGDCIGVADRCFSRVLYANLASAVGPMDFVIGIAQ